MAQISDLQTKDCLVWETERPTFDIPRKSSNFWLLGCQWYFHLRISNPLNEYYITAQKAVQSEIRLKHNVTVKTFIRDEASGICMSNDAQNVRADGYIWEIDIASVINALGSYSPHRKWTITFVFHSDFPLMLHVSTSEKASPGSFALIPDFESLSLDLSKLLKDEVLPDVELKCAERTISAHRAVLAARSDVFLAMFRNKMAESETGTIDITDLDARVLELFVKYVYTGQIQVVPEDLMPGLYAAADKYAVGCLKKSCADQMIESLTKDNCVSFLTLADEHSDDAFKKTVVFFICGHEAILQSEVWLSFCEKNSKLANEVYQRFVVLKSKRNL